jgi:ribonucrease Y
MPLQLALLLALLTGLLGVLGGYFLRLLIAIGEKGSVEIQVKQMLLEAKEEAAKITTKAQLKATETVKNARLELKEREDELKKTGDRLVQKEESLDRKQADIEKEVDHIKSKIEEIREIKKRTEDIEEEKRKELEAISKLSEEEAKTMLLNIIEKKHEEDLLVRIKKIELTGQEKLERKAREIITSAIHRLGNSVASDTMSTTVTIPSDEIKGKVIGKEGRNIKAFERSTGVEIIVDDTPGSILISSFDPVRRQIARLALENLILDGRIQPAKIESTVEKARLEINKIIKEKGEQAVYECGVYNLDPRIVSILGRLYFRTSYGQNVLQHSIEMAHIAGVIAEELGADVAVAKAGALLHDIGKAVDHEVQGTHVEIGKRILQKFGADEKIILAMQAHHEEYPYETVESIIVQVADAISGSRPGARRDSVENYLKRLEELETIATSFSGVDKAYALEAGREIRIFVRAEDVNDLDARKMAQEIAARVESELRYPGEIKINVIRESRAIEYAR